MTRPYEDVINVAFDQWDQYATQVAAEGAHGITFAAFVRARLAAAGYSILKTKPSIPGASNPVTDEMPEAYIASPLPTDPEKQT